MTMKSRGLSGSSRRQFLAASLAGGSLVPGPRPAAAPGKPPERVSDHGYTYRIAFGCWINDMRSEVLPLQQWPAPHLDEVTVSSIVAAMDVQRDAGFNYLDAWGLFATY